MELVNIRYAGIQVIAFSIASGQGEEQDEQIWNGLNRISWFFCCLYEGRNNRESSFPRQPILAKRSQEQIEEEGGSEEIETLLINKGNQNYNIKGNAKWAKRSILNHFIHKRQL
ncbi:MAG: hypothetical protein EZS28_004585 [Streblomastix strix]|uniref:Uncharacterized protein n=1 Tax=Streblomastix strix TaxID=222440 RepID=A0A5J4WZH6_9EUKA|nr:MAG: hypothetical protein EZS28_004585 [Streblomastix strix]